MWGWPAGPGGYARILRLAPLFGTVVFLSQANGVWSPLPVVAAPWAAPDSAPGGAADAPASRGLRRPEEEADVDAAPGTDLFTRHSNRQADSVYSAAAGPAASSGSAVSSAASAAPPLRFAQLVFRHGARAPLTDKYGARETVWDVCSQAYATVGLTVRALDGGPRPASPMDDRQVATLFAGGCHKGQLTALGQLQARQLGTWLRTRYVTQAGLLSPVWQEGAVTVRTTNLSRTVGTAAGLLTGLYPDLVATLQPVELLTVPDDKEWLYPNAQSCPRLKELYAALKHVGEDAQGKQVQAQVAAAMALPPDEAARVDVVGVRDVFVSRAAHGKPTPGVDASLAAALEREAVRRVVALMAAGAPDEAKGTPAAHRRVRLSIGKLLYELLTNLERAADSRLGPKLRLYSGHDTTLLPLQYALGLDANHWPPFAANVALELLQEEAGGPAYVRVMHNGAAAELPGCAAAAAASEAAGGPPGLCPLEAFKSLLAPFAMPEKTAAAECAAHLKSPPPPAATAAAGEGDVPAAPPPAKHFKTVDR